MSAKKRTETPEMRLKVHRMGTAILNFAHKKGYTINPGAGMRGFIDSFLVENFCPCDPKRTHCPCANSVMDMEKEGRCLCGLLWKDIPTFEASHWPPVPADFKPDSTITEDSLQEAKLAEVEAAIEQFGL